MKLTALEILKKIGSTFTVGDQEYTAEEVIGKARVRIGGISGISNPDHLIRIAGSNTVEVIVGNQTYQVEV